MEKERTANALQEGAASTTTRKRKRTKRSRSNRKGKDAADDDGDQGEDEDDKVEAIPSQAGGEEEPERKRAIQVQDQPHEDEDEDEEGGKASTTGEKGKRKRKRNRSSKKKPNEAENERTTDQHNQSDLGPDPNLDPTLSEQAKKAISYAIQFKSDRGSWKFAKSKQNWLLRHCLDAVEDGGESKPAEEDKTAGGDQDPNPNPDQAEPEGGGGGGGSFIPEGNVNVVGFYLNSVMGGAKERLIRTLLETYEATKVEVPTEPTKPIVKEGSEARPSGEKEQGGDKAKTTRFGEMAMKLEKGEETKESEDGGAPWKEYEKAMEERQRSILEERRVERRRERAKRLLRSMGQVV
ncbi:hypothetical protein IE53DRAFT_390506 [Violaceomyces palustris]|uniref:Uncharacterized protein n=1 Tax=Violaceomyces palustris TaxID=1673888 RepID=A0ACD0NNG5_9BASI|nr:hypothetical protein IE53DRAFT_390506 [Violaceomyces palustris]